MEESCISGACAATCFQHRCLWERGTGQKSVLCNCKSLLQVMAFRPSVRTSLAELRFRGVKLPPTVQGSETRKGRVLKEHGTQSQAGHLYLPPQPNLLLKRRLACAQPTSRKATLVWTSEGRGCWWLRAIVCATEIQHPMSSCRGYFK
eukprot:5020700-Amphidinium_carterae.1